MKTSIEFELEPFAVPDFVNTKRSPLSNMDSLPLSLRALDFVTLEDLCSQFRASVLRKASMDSGLAEKGYSSSGNY